MPTNLSVVSLNVYGTPFVPHKVLRTLMRNNIRKRFKLIAKEIQKVSPDIIFLQEVHDYFHLRYLMNHLKEYKYSFYRHSYFGPRGGLVTMSKFQLARKHFIDFHTRGKLFDKSITGHLSGKGVLLSHIHGTDVYLLNTHLTQNSKHDWDKKNNYTSILQSQLTQLNQLVKTFAQRGKALIFAGDFNMPKDSSYYKNFVNDTKLHDAFKKDSFPTYHEVFLPEGQKVGRLDFIFHSSTLTPKKVAYILKDSIKEKNDELYLSDHIGLFALFNLKS